MKSVKEGVKTIASIVPQVLTASANGTGVDTKGYNSGKAVIIAGDIDLANADETYNFKVQESADNSAWSDVTGLTGEVTADNDVVEIAVERLGTTRSRYLRVVATLAGTTPSCPLTAHFELGNAYQNPVS